MLPDSLITANESDSDTARPLVALLAWVEVLRTASLEDFRKVFPIDPPAQDFGWALQIAQQITRLQHVLAESGLLLSDVEKRAGDGFVELERWQQIARLHRLHETRLAQLGVRDRHAVRVSAIENAGNHRRSDDVEVLKGVREIIVLALADPQPLAISVLAKWAETTPVHVLVFAPLIEAPAFDGWGRPLETAWNERVLEIADFEDRIRVCADPFAQAGDAIELMHGYESPENAVAIGIADADVLPPLESALRQSEFISFSPEGRRRSGDAMYQLVTALAALSTDEAFANVETLARCPDFLKFLNHKFGAEFNGAEFLRMLDRLHARHLPPTLADARRHLPNTPSLEIVSELRDRLNSGPFSKTVADTLSWIFGARKFDALNTSDASTMKAAGVWTDVLAEMALAEEAFPRIARKEWWDLALQLYGENMQYDEKRAGAVELQGWLELLWEDAPHLVVCGFNDGRVPEAVVGDPFLPESLRERLGLKTNAARFARDAYMLQAIASSRITAGRLDLLLGKSSTSGDPLRPSRLLLRCADEELPARVRFLFKPAESSGSRLAWRRAWKLSPDRVPAPPRIAVTAFRSWLGCPFRFYLSRVLRMEAVEPAKTELDVFDFGTLCHAALEAMGRSALIRDCTDEGTIQEFLLSALDAEVRKRFGSELTLPLIVQVESARQRLSRAAVIQAETRREGWMIVSVETGFEFQVGKIQVVGKIDRIDRHEHTGVVRVLDYKTSDQPVKPLHAHVRRIHSADATPECARFNSSGQSFAWIDLQLPLYRRAFLAGCLDSRGLDGGSVAGATGEGVVCAYFNLPKAAAQTGIQSWDDCGAEIDESAWRCAQGVAEAIHRGEFWPPNENVRPDLDAFYHFFHHGVVDSVAWSENPADASDLGHVPLEEEK